MRKRVCVIGVGYVGLPLACILANSGYSVLAVDIDKKVLSRIKSPGFDTPERGLKDLFMRGIQTGNLETSTKVQSADIYIIAVQTPLDLENHPDVSHVNKAVNSIKPHLKPDNLILIESTCPIGTTETLGKQLKAACSGFDIYIAYCPERILPGDVIHELTHNNRIVGGLDAQSSLYATDFYRSFTCGEVEVTNTRTAEAVKLAENAYRDINIAYANELSLIADNIDVNIHELIRLANKHPRVDILQPGTGVGGHCIAVDPYFLVHCAPELATLILKARQVNIRKTEWVTEKIRTVAYENSIKNIACFGLTYKPDVSDIRNSPAVKIREKLKKEFEVISVDPYIKNTATIAEAIMKSEIIVMLVAHREFLHIPNHLFNKKIFLDFTGEFT